jgi:8-oxo-dGTP pyrophosphatase MutT (NUDIX family)
MKLLKTITNQDIFPESNMDQQIEYRIREAARAIVFDRDNNIAILNVTKLHYHKLPGGGIEKGEDIFEALNREMIEEIGCQIEVTGELGQIDEYRDEIKLYQKSYCYVAKVDGEKGTPQFVDDEIVNGFEIMWVKLDEAIKILSGDITQDYAGKFILMRDLIFLNEVKII